MTGGSKEGGKKKAPTDEVRTVFCILSQSYAETSQLYTPKSSAILFWTRGRWLRSMHRHSIPVRSAVEQGPDPDEAMAAASTGPAEKQPLLPAAAGAAAAAAAAGAAASAASGQPAAGSAQPPAGASQKSLQSQQVPIRSHIVWSAQGAKRPYDLYRVAVEIVS